MRKVRQLTEPRGRVRFLSVAERDALLIECKAHSAALHTIVVLALSTGARRGEILGLRWPDVDMQRGYADLPPDEERGTPLNPAGELCGRTDA